MSAWIVLLFSSALDGSYARLSAASWAVVIGVAIEETPLFLKIASFFRGKFAFLAWNTGGISWLKKHEKTFEAFGFILLVLGLVLEIRFQGSAQSAEKDARVASEVVVQGLRVRATNAEGEIADAKRDAANAIRDAARLGVTVKNLQGLVDTAQTKAAEQSAALQKATVAFDNSISAANKEVVDLEKSLLPRVFTFHVDDFISLRAFANIPVFLSSPAGEPNDLLQELSVMFFPAIPFESKEPGNSVFMNGIEIRYPLDDEVSAQYALLVCQEIRKSHLEVSTHREDATSAFWDPKLPSKSLWIRVGARESSFSIKQREEEARAMTDPYAKSMFTSESGCGDEPLPPPPQ